MNPEKFVKELRILRDNLLKGYFQEGPLSQVKNLKENDFSPEQIKLVRELLNSGLTDALYNVLLGLDGCAFIGNEQNEYTLKDESGNIIAGNGELESFAWEEFHNRT